METKALESKREGRPLRGRVAVVTGSTSGIGLGIARALAAAGADIVVNGLGGRAEIDRLCERLADENGVKAVYDDADLMDKVEARKLIVRSTWSFGKVDILVNNAGVQHVSQIESFPEEKWDSILALNLSAAFHTTKACFAAMKAAGFGRVINIASAHGLVASPFKSAYVAAKHGLVGLTKAAALEGAEFGVTCNAICPGYVWTPLVERQIDDTAAARGLTREGVIRDVLLAAQPTKRFAEVEENGALAAFLASDAGASITGAALPIDGGWTAH
ncbi:3-hydroxybutyrate dehydrogenase [Methylosinus sp. Ce-a6]|uniref:3-hydroxybutyrate dehydrogenase n=1 Tax=Methylosinus sp. Ce-a6 TaxID=2172005 RepID=UPI001356FF61|nr:3-hydroxybutyrate dehydrogenase [Methylosinus sp. Ce-a6]